MSRMDKIGHLLWDDIIDLTSKANESWGSCSFTSEACCASLTCKPASGQANFLCHFSNPLVYQIRGRKKLTWFNNNIMLVLHLAAINGHLQICKFIKDWGHYFKYSHEPDIQFILAQTAANGHLDVCKFLCNWINLAKPTNQVKCMPAVPILSYYRMLQYASLNGHLHICQWLKDSGLTLNGPLTGAEGYKAFELANSRGHTKVCEFLKLWLGQRNPWIVIKNKIYNYIFLHGFIHFRFHFVTILSHGTFAIVAHKFGQHPGHGWSASRDV